MNTPHDDTTSPAPPSADGGLEWARPRAAVVLTSSDTDMRTPPSRRL